MTAHPIIKMGHPTLRRVSDVIADPQLPEISQVITDMHDSMVAAGGVGLAAPQIDVALQLVIFSAPESRGTEDKKSIAPPTILINPEIEILSDEIAYDWEGCLSVPGLRGLVPRYTRIRYRGLGPDGEAIEREATDFHARVVQHEVDHLNGILYPQRMDDLSDLYYEDEWIREFAQDPTPESDEEE